MTLCNAADESGCVSPDRVRNVIQGLLRSAQAMGVSDQQLEGVSGVKARAIKSYRVEGREPSLSAALSLAVALGEPAVNAVLSIIGYGARALGDADEKQPMQIAADAMAQLAVIASAAADGRIDHTERPAVTEAADAIIATILPLASAGGRP